MTNYVTDIEFTKIIKFIFKKMFVVLFLVHIFVIIYLYGEQKWDTFDKAEAKKYASEAATKKDLTILEELGELENNEFFTEEM